MTNQAIFDLQSAVIDVATVKGIVLEYYNDGSLTMSSGVAMRQFWVNSDLVATIQHTKTNRPAECMYNVDLTRVRLKTGPEPDDFHDQFWLKGKLLNPAEPLVEHPEQWGSPCNFDDVEIGQDFVRPTGQVYTKTGRFQAENKADPTIVTNSIDPYERVLPAIETDPPEADDPDLTTIAFAAVPVGGRFAWGGNEYIKVNTFGGKGVKDPATATPCAFGESVPVQVTKENYDMWEKTKSFNEVKDSLSRWFMKVDIGSEFTRTAKQHEGHTFMKTEKNTAINVVTLMRFRVLGNEVVNVLGRQFGDPVEFKRINIGSVFFHPKHGACRKLGDLSAHKHSTAHAIDLRTDDLVLPRLSHADKAI